MIVVSDTSPLTALIHIGRIDLLFRLFGRVVIPTAVRDELLRGHSTLPAGFSINVAQDRGEVARLRAEIDLGEAEAIVLAREVNADFLLIDERIGRSVARNRGLRIIGLAGVVVMAKNARYIESAQALLTELAEIGGMYVSDDLWDWVLDACGES